MQLKRNQRGKEATCAYYKTINVNVGRARKTGPKQRPFNRVLSLPMCARVGIGPYRHMGRDGRHSDHFRPPPLMPGL